MWARTQGGISAAAARAAGSAPAATLSHIRAMRIGEWADGETLFWWGQSCEMK